MQIYYLNSCYMSYYNKFSLVVSTLIEFGILVQFIFYPETLTIGESIIFTVASINTYHNSKIATSFL